MTSGSSAAHTRSAAAASPRRASARPASSPPAGSSSALAADQPDQLGRRAARPLLRVHQEVPDRDHGGHVEKVVAVDGLAQVLPAAVEVATQLAGPQARGLDGLQLQVAASQPGLDLVVPQVHLLAPAPVLEDPGADGQALAELRGGVDELREVLGALAPALVLQRPDRAGAEVGPAVHERLLDVVEQQPVAGGGLREPPPGRLGEQLHGEAGGGLGEVSGVQRPRAGARRLEGRCRFGAAGHRGRLEPEDARAKR